jgi:hypothetical protein
VGSLNSVQRHSVGAMRSRASCGIRCLLITLVATILAPGFVFGEPIRANLEPVSGVPNLLRDPESYTIAQIIARGGIIIGDKLFDSFSVTDTGLAPDASNIKITPVQVLYAGAPFGGDYGMTFNGLWSALANSMADSTIVFRASILPAYAARGYAFKDNSLWLSGYGGSNTPGSGAVSVSENLYANHPSSGGPSFADKFVYYHTSADNQLRDTQSFAPITQMWVVKDVGAFGGPVGMVHLSEFYQTFSQVPEPGTFVLVVIGAVTLGGYAWRKRRGPGAIDAA